MASKICGENYITCPYNPAHRLPEGRFQTHLVRCKRHYLDLNFATCIYNSTHVLPEPELKHHQEHCKDKYLLDRHIYMPENVDRNKYPVKNLVIDTGESWDDEDVPTYDPEEYCKNKPILRKLDVAPESKRREFRMEERLRFAQLANPPEPKYEEYSVRRPKDKSASMVDTFRYMERDVPQQVTRSLQVAISEIDAAEAGPSGMQPGSRSPTERSPQKKVAKEEDSDGFQVVVDRRFGRGRGRGRGSSRGVHRGHK